MSQEQLEQTLEALSAFFRSERCAAEVYRAASDRVQNPALRSQLDGLRCSHEGRACLLRERLGEFGGTCGTANSGDGWGAFSNVGRKLGHAADDDGVLAALREGESLAMRDYEIDLNEVQSSLRNELAAVLLLEQRRTCEHVETLSAPSRATAKRRAG